eukprot:496650-Ditylum_brightwellii.AAC.1
MATAVEEFRKIFWSLHLVILVLPTKSSASSQQVEMPMLNRTPLRLVSSMLVVDAQTQEILSPAPVL